MAEAGEGKALILLSISNVASAYRTRRYEDEDSICSDMISLSGDRKSHSRLCGVDILGSRRTAQARDQSVSEFTKPRPINHMPRPCDVIKAIRSAVER